MTQKCVGHPLSMLVIFEHCASALLNLRLGLVVRKTKHILHIDLTIGIAIISQDCCDSFSGSAFRVRGQMSPQSCSFNSGDVISRNNSVAIQVVFEQPCDVPSAKICPSGGTQSFKVGGRDDSVPINIRRIECMFEKGDEIGFLRPGRNYCLYSVKEPLLRRAWHFDIHICLRSSLARDLLPCRVGQFSARMDQSFDELRTINSSPARAATSPSSLSACEFRARSHAPADRSIAGVF